MIKSIYTIKNNEKTIKNMNKKVCGQKKFKKIKIISWFFKFSMLVISNFEEFNVKPWEALKKFIKGKVKNE